MEQTKFVKKGESNSVSVFLMSILRYLDFFLKIQIYSTGCPRKWCQFMCGEPFSPMAMFSGTPGVSVLDWGLSQSQGLLGYCNKANLSNVLELNVSYSLKDCHVYGCLIVKKNVHHCRMVRLTHCAVRPTHCTEGRQPSVLQLLTLLSMKTRILVLKNATFPWHCKNVNTKIFWHDI